MTAEIFTFVLGLAAGLGIAHAVRREYRKKMEALQTKLEEAESKPAPEPVIIRESAPAVRPWRDGITEDPEQDAQAIVLSAIERIHLRTLSEATTAVVQLPSEDVKGRIIGRDGRNIRAFEQVTGVDLIVDDAPKSVLLSTFDPVRRETARLALINLIADGRIHPARIEELHQEAEKAIESTLKQAGEDAALAAGLPSLQKAIKLQMGRLKFRSSYGQNVLEHSVETAKIAALLAHELGFEVEKVRLAAFLHDIGKGLKEDGPHALTGMAFANKHGLPPDVCDAIGAHHREIPVTTAIAQLVIVADSLSASRPGARRESLEAFQQRLSDLEAAANAIEGVESCYAIQAGREIRVIVKPEFIRDDQMPALAQEIATKIREVSAVGELKVTLIRETRVQETV